MAEQLAPAPPSEQEKLRYYDGLPSRPRLVARTGRDPWTGPTGETDTSHLKWLVPIGQHPVAAIWAYGPLQTDIMKILDEGRIDWCAVDVLRLARMVESQVANPAVILVSVRPDSCLWHEAYRAAYNCKSRLARDGILDVEVEIKESLLDRSMQPQPPQVSQSRPQSASIKLMRHHAHPHQLPLTEYLGTPITNLHDPDLQGTKGLYLKDGKSGKVFLLTCRHVVLKHLPPDQEYRYSAGGPEQPVIQVAQGEFAGLLDLLPDNLQPAAQAIDDPASRVIGRVQFSPPMTLDYEGPGTPYDPNRPGRLRDWAIAELFPDRHTTPLGQLTNRVYTKREFAMFINQVTKRDTRASDAGKRHLMDKNRHGEDNFSLELWRTTIPEREQRAPPYESTALGVESIVVAKHGFTSKFTVGLTNEVTSLLREPVAGVSRIATEWCVMGHREANKMVRPFSEPGDSGACVFDARGRVGGMITGGNAAGGSKDVTYASMMDWLIQDIRSFGFDVQLLGEEEPEAQAARYR